VFFYSTLQISARDVELTLIRPVKELKGFTEALLEMGETKNVF